MNIKGKIGIVTGGASGIGLAVAEMLAEKGLSRVGLVDRDPVVRDRAAEMNQIIGRQVAVPFVIDVTDETGRKQVFDTLEEEAGDVVRILVPAAGIIRDRFSVKADKASGRFLTPSTEDWGVVLQVNMVAPLMWASEVTARIREGQKDVPWSNDQETSATTIFIGSVCREGNAGQLFYSTAKGGLESGYRTANLEWVRYGIRCGLIDPGYTDTPMVRSMPQKALSGIICNTRRGKLIDPKEVARWTCVLIENESCDAPIRLGDGLKPSYVLASAA